MVRVFYLGKDSYGSKYALNVSQSSLIYFQKMFDIKYPNSKLDIFPVPDYTGKLSLIILVEGMENFGLVTIENKRFSINKYSSTDDLFYICTLLSHEIAHQWLGDIVTMGKWSDLWLNEGFAEYLQYHSVTDYFKDTESMFYINEFVIAFEADSSWFTHAVLGIDDNTPTNLFDDVTYNKGAVILSMISKFMDGTRFVNICRNFCEKLRIYLSRYMFSNAMTKDLLDILGNEVSGHIKSWIYQPGFPVVHVSTKVVEKDIIKIMLTQKRFNLLNKASNSLWNISISIKLFDTHLNGSIKSFKLMNVIFDDENMELSIPAYYRFLINADTGGFYYTHYGSYFGDLASIISQNNRMFSDFEKAHFIYQSFQLSLSLQSEWNDAIKSLDILKNETSATVWKTVLKLWFQLEGILNLHPTFQKFKEKVRDKLPLLGQKWPESTIMFLGVLTESADYIKASRNVFFSWNTSEPINVNPDYLDAIYYSAMKYEESFEMVWASNSIYPGDRLKALIFSQFPFHQKRVFSLIQRNLSVSDRNLYFGYFIFYSPVTYRLVWNFAKNEFPSNLENISGQNIKLLVSKFAQDPNQLHELQFLISETNGRSWDIPNSTEPYIYKYLRRGIEWAISGIAFRSVNMRLLQVQIA